MMLGQTTRMTSEKRPSLRFAILLRMLQAASIPMTVVFPVPVAILQARRGKAPDPIRLCFRPGLIKRDVDSRAGNPGAPP